MVVSVNCISYSHATGFRHISTNIKILKNALERKKHPIQTVYIKASILSMVECPFRIHKCQFGFKNH